MQQRPPGPKPHFLIGNMPLASRDPLAVITRWAREYGDIFYYRAGWIHVYFINRPDLVEFVLLRNHANLFKDRVIQNSRWFFGDGLLTSEGEEWKRQRRLTQPAFHRERLGSYAGIMVDYTDEMLSGWRDGAIIDVHQELMNLALRIVVRTLFGVEAEETNKISRALNTMMRHSAGVRLLLPAFARRLPLPGMADVRRAVKDLRDTVSRIINVRRARSEQDSEDLLSLLVAARDEDGSALSVTEVRDQVLTFLLAGHETTALALSWTLYLLSQNPEAENKLHQEVATLLGHRAPNSADVGLLIYTDFVIKESMRLYPPAWSLARQAAKSFEVEGYSIPADANVVMSQWILQRDPRFFRDPVTFNPDRWVEEACQKLPRFAYFPFGGGPRQCIGAGFAMMESVLLLATIAQRFKLRLVEHHPVVPVPGFTLRPKYGIRMTVNQR
ncbi:MAG: cytochrome family protein [Acidobacteriaceae bacterium]|nr:cytochrome family protein [Acidobacteriaceae bacterium]